jgi:hypothetical protein
MILPWSAILVSVNKFPLLCFFKMILPGAPSLCRGGPSVSLWGRVGRWVGGREGGWVGGLLVGVAGWVRTVEGMSCLALRTRKYLISEKILFK